jgi:hypothetical protein
LAAKVVRRSEQVATAPMVDAGPPIKASGVA